MEIDHLLPITTRQELRTWLEQNHRSSSCCWVLTTRKPSPHAIPYLDAVEEALCFGWIDSVSKTRDETTRYQRFGPRNPASTWVKSNRDRVARLTASGEMAPAGLALVKAAKASGVWDLLADVEEGIVPDDVRAALDAVPDAAINFDAFPAGVRKAILMWIVSAKRPATREARIATTVEKAARGERSGP